MFCNITGGYCDQLKDGAKNCLRYQVNHQDDPDEKAVQPTQ